VSLPGLAWQSIRFRKPSAKKMDPRVKPAGDAVGERALNEHDRIMLPLIGQSAAPEAEAVERTRQGVTDRFVGAERQHKTPGFDARLTLTVALGVRPHRAFAVCFGVE
jgi:hypothetical protein